MTFKPKIWQLVIAASAVVVIARFNELIVGFRLMFLFAELIFKDPSSAWSQFEFRLFDAFFSSLFIIVLPLWVYAVRNRIALFRRKIDFTSVMVIILLFFFLFAPIVAGTNPEFQKNLAVTKLLPPLSSVDVIHLKEPAVKKPSYLKKFLSLKTEVVKRSFDESIILADSVSVSDDIIYYQKNRPYHLAADTVAYNDGKPFVTKTFYLLGTDELGRDIFSRLVYGARISLFVGLGSVVISLILGLLLGFLAGYPGGITDTSLSRVTDMFLAFPVIFLIILILALFGNSLLSVIIVLGFSGWMSLFKIVRGEVISLKSKDFFVTAKFIGLSGSSLLRREVLPVILAPIIVNLVFQYGNVILAEAALSYLGLGTGSSYPSWGAMIESGQNYLSQAWWMIFFPGIILFLTLFAANNVGKEINIFFNPRLKA